MKDVVDFGDLRLLGLSMSSGRGYRSFESCIVVQSPGRLFDK